MVAEVERRGNDEVGIGGGGVGGGGGRTRDVLQCLR